MCDLIEEECEGAEADLEAAMAHLADSAEDRPVALAGYSFGAWLAVRVAARRGSHVAARRGGTRVSAALAVALRPAPRSSAPMM